jgi:hypothetical protein
MAMLQTSKSQMIGGREGSSGSPMASMGEQMASLLLAVLPSYGGGWIPDGRQGGSDRA